MSASTEVRSRPILFSGPMVRAILEGRKTQTRRMVKLPEKKSFTGSVNPDGLPIIRHELSEFKGRSQMKRIKVFHEKCPHGTIGDRLWVREAWCHKFVDSGFVYNTGGNLDSTCCLYRADGVHVVSVDDDGFTKFNKDGTESSPWRPSIHMPRWASRITLEITGVRVERLQEISEDDAAAEGVPCEPIFDTDRGIDGKAFPRNEFQSLWQSINGPESWAANPWVWVIEFRRVEQC